MTLKTPLTAALAVALVACSAPQPSTTASAAGVAPTVKLPPLNPEIGRAHV